MPKKKEQSEKINFPNKYVVIGADLSLRCPGFCTMKVKDGKITYIRLTSINNKGKGKTHGCILREIYDEVYYSVLKPILFTDQVYLVREKEIMHMNTPSERDISKVVGIMDYIADELYNDYSSTSNHEGYWHDVYPVTVKKCITGSGKATKEEVAKALEKYVGKQEYKCDDESDATAVAIAWLIQQGQLEAKV